MGRNELAIFQDVNAPSISGRPGVTVERQLPTTGFISLSAQQGERLTRFGRVAADNDLAARRGGQWIGRHPRDRDNRYHLVAGPHHSIALDPGHVALWGRVDLPAAGLSRLPREWERAHAHQAPIRR